MQIRYSIPLAMAAGLLAACGGSGSSSSGGEGDDSFSDLRVEPETASLIGCQSVEWQVVGVRSDGSEETVTDRTGVDADPDGVVALLREQGRLGGVGSGTAAVTANVDGLSASGSVTVDDGVDDFTPRGNPTPGVAVGDEFEVQFSALRNGSAIDEAELDDVLVWLTPDSTLSIVEREGARITLSADEPGEAMVEAACGGHTAGFEVTVAEAEARELRIDGDRAITLVPGEQRELSAQATLSDGSTMDVTELGDWSVPVGQGAVEVSNQAGSKGLVQAIGSGSDFVAIAYQGLEDSIAVQVAE